MVPGHGADTRAHRDGDPADVVAVEPTSPACSRRAPRFPGRPRRRVAWAHRTARAGPSNVARKPSPMVLTSRPRYRARCARTTWSCRRSRTCRHARSPRAADCAVESTMSVNSTVASTRSSTARHATPGQKPLELEVRLGLQRVVVAAGLDGPGAGGSASGSRPRRSASPRSASPAWATGSGAADARRPDVRSRGWR